MLIPKKSLGQNFLKDKNIAIKIVKSTKIFNNNVLEIGPGLGFLTSEIIKLKPKKFLIIEKDKILYEKLIIKFNKSVTIICNDALLFNYKDLKNYKIIANLPYNISSKFLLKIIKLNENFSEIVCMIQSELAEKFDYRKKTMNKYKFLSEFCGKYEILFDVSPKVFYPKPKVKSKVVRFVLKKQKINIKKLDKFIKIFFVKRRKKIKSNNFFNKIIDSKLINKRYEELNYNEVLKIYERFNLPIS